MAVLQFPILEKNAAVTALSALAHPSRLSVFQALVRAGKEGINPGIVAKQLDLPPATLSFHLKELSHAGLASSEQSGKFVFYRANFGMMNSLMQFLSAQCCDGSAEGCEVKWGPCDPEAPRAKPVSAGKLARKARSVDASTA
jgi:ArsR family transcriptional regulator